MPDLAASDCEALSAGLLAQPINAVSSLALVAAAAWLWARSDRWEARTMALALLIAGVGSFAYHGPQPAWAAPVHDLGVGLVVVVGGTVAMRSVLASGVASLGLPAAVLVTAAIVDVLGRTGRVFCFADSWAQAHALWHVGAAVGLAMLGDRARSAPVTGDDAPPRRRRGGRSAGP